jgi:hypothetical protein
MAMQETERPDAGHSLSGKMDGLSTGWQKDRTRDVAYPPRIATSLTAARGRVYLHGLIPRIRTILALLWRPLEERGEVEHPDARIPRLAYHFCVCSLQLSHDDYLPTSCAYLARW